jgi:ABC-type transport system involved in multi-copper enzyme maturation permease subunit
MSSSSTPGFGTAVGAVFRMQWKRLIRGRRIRLAIAIVAVVLVVGTLTAARYAAPETVPIPDLVRDAIDWGFFVLLGYLIPFLFTAGTISQDVDSRTFSYFSTRPVDRHAILLGQYLLGAAVAATILTAGVITLHLACFITEPSLLVDELPSTLRALGALLLLCIAYSAICSFWGSLVPDAAGLVATLHLAVLEFLLSNFPYVRLISMNYLATELAGLPKGGLPLPFGSPDIEPYIAAGVIPAVAIAFLALATVVVSTSEYRFAKA